MKYSLLGYEPMVYDKPEDQADAYILYVGHHPMCDNPVLALVVFEPNFISHIST